MDFFFYFTAVIGVILFGISKGGFGGPIAILSIPLMSLTMSPQNAAGILLPILIVMDFSATWCMPCKTEHPFFIQLKNQFPELLIIGINHKDDKENANNTKIRYG